MLLLVVQRFMKKIRCLPMYNTYSYCSVHYCTVQPASENIKISDTGRLHRIAGKMAWGRFILMVSGLRSDRQGGVDLHGVTPSSIVIIVSNEQSSFLSLLARIVQVHLNEIFYKIPPSPLIHTLNRF
jgi:hypothetical protein